MPRINDETYQKMLRQIASAMQPWQRVFVKQIHKDIEQFAKRVLSDSSYIVGKIGQLEQLEREAGFASPSESGFVELLRTSSAALEAAIKTQDWQTACEAMVFLQQALASLHVKAR